MIIPDNHLAKINTDLGVELSAFEINNEFQHFGENGLKNANKKPIWVIGKTWEYKGNAYFYVQYGDFRGGSKFQLASYDIKEQNAQFRKAHNDQIKDIESRAKAEKDDRRKKGIDKWRPRFYDCKVTEVPHDYLAKKSIDKNYRARVNYQNTLLIPLESLDDDLNFTFEGVQMVWRDPETMKWVKRYNEGVVKKGSFTRVVEFDIKKTEFIYLCEGYATACSVYMATGVSVVVAFDSGNLDTVIEKLKALNPDIKIIICADDDFQTMISGKQVNVGILKAITCTKKFQNVTYKKPRFAHRVDETDFNDLHILEGLEVVRDQLKINRAEFTDVILLGHLDHKEFYYLCTQSKSIVSLAASQHDGKYLKAIANEKYWAEKFGGKKNDETGELFPIWNKIADRLLDKQREIGIFDPKRIRGVGVWDDEGRVLVNYGQGVYDATRKVSLSNIDPYLKSKNFYNAATGDAINFDDELTDDESMKIAEAIRSLNFKTEHDYVFVIGFIAIANVFGALPWRPHLWITAPSGSGKSWIIKQLHKLIHFSFYIKRGSLAGVQQYLDNHAKCVVYDEAEASEEIERIVAMARECSTNDGALIVKGSTGGKARVTESNACFLMTSIEPPELNKADDSRFFIVEMANNEKQTSQEFAEIEKLFKAIDGMAPRLMARLVNNIDMLKNNIEVAKRALKAKGISSREADQLSPIIAGFYLFFTRGELAEGLVQEILAKMGLDKSDYVERNEDKQEERAYQALMMLQLDNSGFSLMRALKLLSGPSVDSIDQGLLHNHGMIYDKKSSQLFIASKCQPLTSKLKRMGVQNYSKVLARHESCVHKNWPRRVPWSSKPVKGLILEAKV